jgi:hypothetical protein
VIRPRRTIHRSEWILAVVVSLTAGLVIALGSHIPGLVPGWVFAVLLGGGAVFILMHSLSGCRASLRLGGGFSHLGSAAFSAAVLLAVLLPGAQLLAGARRSRLEDLGFPTPNPAPDIAVAFLLFGMAVAALYFGETLADGRPPARARQVGFRGGRSIGRTWESRITYGFLILMGVALLEIYGSSANASFASRGKVTGQGIFQLGGYAVPIAIGIGILNRHWGSRTLMGVSLAAGALLIPSGVRTPLMIIAAAAGLRYLYSTAPRRMRASQLLGWALAIYVGAVVTVGLSTYRGQEHGYQSTGASLTQNIINAAADPFAQLQTQGVDTIDGLILSTKVNRAYVGASWTDPAKVILGFIPHQIWPSKPQWLFTTVTQDYTTFGAGGIFLSSPGYFLIVFGTPVAIPVMFVLLGAFCEALFRRMREPSIWTALLTYFIVRFCVAGDAFDAFHVLGLCLLVLFARTVTSFINVLWRPPETKTKQQVQASAA